MMSTNTQGGADMLSEEVFELWKNYNFRLFVLTTAQLRTKNKKILKRLVGRAWGVVSNGPPQKTTEYYQTMARNAIEREYNSYKYKKSAKA